MCGAAVVKNAQLAHEIDRHRGRLVIHFATVELDDPARQPRFLALDGVGQDAHAVEAHREHLSLEFQQSVPIRRKLHQWLSVDGLVSHHVDEVEQTRLGLVRVAEPAALVFQGGVRDVPAFAPASDDLVCRDTHVGEGTPR